MAAPRDALPGESNRETSRRGIRGIAWPAWFFVRDVEARNDDDDERGKFGLHRNADPKRATMDDRKGNDDGHESAATRIPE